MKYKRFLGFYGKGGMAAIGFLLHIRDVTVMRHSRSSLFRLASYRSMAASSLVDFVFRSKGITFYGSAASFNQHFIAIQSTQQVLFELCSLDVAVRASDART